MAKWNHNTDRRRSGIDELPYEVGNKKPPIKYRFQKGISGNPSGRPKHQSSFGDIVMKELHKKVSVTINGEIVKLPKIQCFATELVNAGIKKGPASKKMLVTIIDTAEAQAAAKEAKEAAELAEKELDGQQPLSWSDEQESLYQELQKSIADFEGGAVNQVSGAAGDEEPGDRTNPKEELED